MHMKTYVAMGSNLSQPVQMVQTAMAELARLPTTRLLQRSSLYQAKPWGPQNQPDFINAVALLETDLFAAQLLEYLSALERQLGRIPSERWGPRVIDLDILLYGDMIMKSDKISIPHPGIYQREFVLFPLAEIAPDLILPTGQSILELKAACDPRGITVLAEINP